MYLSFLLILGNQQINKSTNITRITETMSAQFLADADAPIAMLLSTKDDNKDYFALLTDKEQKYAHYMSKASQFGTRITLRQVSVESELIFDLIRYVHKCFDNGNYPNNNCFKDYLEYVSQFLSNLGNYKSFGDTKFIPKCDQSFFFDYLLQYCQLDSLSEESWSTFTQVHHLYTSNFKNLAELVEVGIYGITEDLSQLGYPSQGFSSSYYLGRDKITPEDMVLLKSQVFTKFNILPENIRIEKIDDCHFNINVASNLLQNTSLTEYPAETIKFNSNGATIIVNFVFGDHTREMQGIVANLEKAKEFAANQTQVQMLDKYIQHFKTGSPQAHKESQIFWVKDISPTIETNIGFIETYREPSGIIGEYEALVAIQNKERTAKFSTMVANAKEFITLLPWDQSFEKPEFNPPDFTSLEVLTFTGSGIPAGINIPNYDDVRLNIGFKNVSLGNILSASTKVSGKHPPTFISEADLPVFQKYQGDSFEVQVGIHELLGHGTGKLLSEIEGGFNFDIDNPPIGLDGKPVSTYYKKSETWGSKFGQLAGSFEECRAEVVAMYLITNRKLLDIFGFKTKEEQDNIIYSGYLQMARAGLLALEFWSPETGKWGQPHMQARFSIMKTFLMHAKNDQFLKIVTNDNSNPTDFHLELDASLIETVGHECVKDYLAHLHVYKCSADVEEGTKYFMDRSFVPKEIARFRDIVINKRLPRRQFIQPNTYLSNDKVVLKEYEETPIGMIQSFIERDL